MNRLKIFCGLLLAAGIFASCGKEVTLTNYLFYFNEEEFTQPGQIADPDVRAFYLDILENFGAGLQANDLWQIDVTNRKFGPDDENAVARFNSTLARIKEREAQYKTSIAALGAHEGSSFHITYVYRLTRDIPADHNTPGYSTQKLGEYTFELRYE